MKHLSLSLALSCFLLTGCTEDPKAASEAQLQSLQQDKVQTLALGSLTERLLGMPTHNNLPVVGEKWVVQVQASYIEFFDKETQEKAFEIDGLEAHMSPVFINASELLVADANQNLWKIDIDTQSKNLVAQLPAPLICSPLIVDNSSIFVQYLNDVVELLSFDGSSQWRTAIMATTSYYRQTAYAPCATRGQIFFAYPGSSVIALNQQTGQIEWIAAPIAQGSISTTAFQVPQVQSPLKVIGDLVVFSTLDHQLYCLDKDSGLVLKKWALWQRSPTLVNNDCVYFVDEMGALSAFDGISQKMLWQQENFSALGFESLVALGNHKIVAQMGEQKLSLIDAESGEVLSEYRHSYPSLQLLATDSDQRLFALDQRKNLIDIPGTLLS